MADLRAKKAGIGAEIDKKLEQPSSSQADLHAGLKNGVKLCHLINTLLQSRGLPKVQVSKKATNTFVAYTNIDNYNKGCLQYGLPKEFTVQSADVWEGRKGPFLNVINNLHCLGKLANDKGFGTRYEGNLNKTLSYD